jgi:hypothetical protein
MTSRIKLLNDYKAELSYLHNQKNEGVTELDTQIWNFTDEESETEMININDVITLIESRISILSDESCSQEIINSLNY